MIVASVFFLIFAQQTKTRIKNVLTSRNGDLDKV